MSVTVHICPEILKWIGFVYNKLFVSSFLCCFFFYVFCVLENIVKWSLQRLTLSHTKVISVLWKKPLKVEDQYQNMWNTYIESYCSWIYMYDIFIQHCPAGWEQFKVRSHRKRTKSTYSWKENGPRKIQVGAKPDRKQIKATSQAKRRMLG